MGNEHWIWLQSVLGYGSDKLIPVLEHFELPEKVYSADWDDLLDSQLFTRFDLQRMDKIKLKDTYEIANKCAKNGYKVVTPDCDEYPDCLFSIHNPPTVLYVRGDLGNLVDEPKIAVVGPRKVSEYGQKAAFSLTYRLASAGFIIVSGEAVGADAFSLYGALAVQSRPICVLGHGFGYKYLMSNDTLRENVAKSGALVTEFQPEYAASKFTFPIRNRILSGLSLGTVIVEAPLKSGSLITASHAAQQGRDVFAVPGNPSVPAYQGSNQLIKDGAKPLLSAVDVIEEYILQFPDKIKLENAFSSDENEYNKELIKCYNSCVSLNAQKPKKEKYITKEKRIHAEILPVTHSFDVSMLSDNAKSVYIALDNPMYPDELVEKLKIDVSLILVALTELEILGCIASLPGGRFALKN